ncbi:hypothetical protein MHH85_05090 [Viridibacillus sp. FSL E2-0187]|uniref:hypothetical protein n=1 Tax=Viridibacillus sp. FSL E2-0187 TaxID=2921362 RepID=UPI0030FC9FEC
MPKSLSKMKDYLKDPFVMNEDTVNIAVYNFLNSVGCDCSEPLKGRSQGVDVQGEKNGWSIYVESKGSHANDADDDTVFGQGQIKVHTYVQVGKLMEYQTENEDNRLFVMANPDIPRIRKRVNSVISSINKLGFIQFWVQEDSTIKIENPEQLNETLISLGLKK